MKKLITLLVTLILVFSLSACGKNDNSSTPPTNDISPTIIPSDNTSPSDEPKEDESYLSKTLVLTLDSSDVDVYWMDNDSVKELKKLAKDGLTIELHQYGGFEQVGSLGSTIKSNDSSITTNAGDICLYQSNQIVFFYGSNTLSYTKLGHINLTKTELVELLGEEDTVTITLNLK
ncbi:sulfurtransferase [Clostridium sp. CAG:288]|nr:sulfurtransferase [Clostridium sp. CAG:288]